MNTTVTEREGRHTELPWRAEGPDPFGDYNILHPADSLAVAAVVSNMRPDIEVKANAALIIRAVNSHDDLVAALELMIVTAGSAPTAKLRREAVVKSLAAIAKAKAGAS
jgi:hypothetical protein